MTDKEKKTSEAQIRASTKWQKQNKERMNYIRKRSAARGFVKVASIVDLYEIQALTKERLGVKNMLEKDDLLNLLESGTYLYGTSYETEKEVAENSLADNQKQVKFLGTYSGDDFEYKDNQFIDGDAIYVIDKNS